MKRIDELKQSFEAAKNAAQTFLNEGKTAEASAKMEEVKNLKAAIEMQAILDAEEMAAIEDKAQPAAPSNKTAENAHAVRAIIKKSMGRSLTEAENALLVPASGDGTNGEGYILPKDVRTLINKKIRQYKSLRDVLGYMPTTALTGSFVVENFETLSELVDFTDGTDGTEIEDIKFKTVSFALKEKGAILKLSNTLLQMTDNDLISYVAEIFAKKAVITENKIALAALKNGKSEKVLADWQALKTSINVDIDEGVKYGLAIVTNQDGFDILDKALDGNGRPILQPNPANPTQRLFMGYPVHVYSNAMLPTEAQKAPIFYGNLQEAVKFVDNNQYAFATSAHAGFTSNTTIARVIEFVDVVQVDNSDKIYIYGTLSTAAVLAAAAKSK